MNNISILIVEDDIKLLNRQASYLSIFCDTIYKASNGSEAIEIYKKHNPNIILTDVNIPKITGIELIEYVRRKDNDTQVVILSGETQIKDLLKVISLNLVDYLVKPIQMEELKKTILKAIKNISKGDSILLEYDYSWNKITKSLYLKDEKVKLTSKETDFFNILVRKLNQSVSYEELHNSIYNYDDYSQSAIFTIVKRIRQKTQKELIQSCYKFGYKIVPQS